MRKEEIEILNDIERLEKDQIYLMEQPKTPQQQFLHLFGHRHLLKQKMIHKNLDRCLDLLPGSFAQVSLKLAYSVLCIENQFEVQQGLSPLVNLVNSWIGYYPSLRGRNKILVGEIVLQQETAVEDVNGYDLYLHYLNLISLDLWKLLKRGGKSEDQFFKERPLKQQIEDWSKKDLRHLDATDLLTFVSSCLPKTLLNVVLDKSVLPAQMRQKYSKFECLYSNQAIEYELRSSLRLSLLLKNIFLLLLQMELNNSQLKFMMLIAMRYYYVYHFQRRFSAAEIIIYTYNKLTDDIRKNLTDQFSLFIKIILKLGKEKFTDFLANNSAYLKAIIESIRKKPMIGYPQESASPYNTIGIGETIVVERGTSTSRFVEILEDFSLFYYRIVVDNLDITVKVHYLGDVGSSKEINTVLFTQEKKSGVIKNCINAIKKGIYMFQFDNSYSWINSKTVKFQTVVYSPLEIKTTTTDEWLPDFYENIFQNAIADKKSVVVVSNKKVEFKKNATAALTKKGDTFSLWIVTQAHSYHYETDSALRMEQKVIQTLKNKEQYAWSLNGKNVAEFDQITNFLKGKKASIIKEEPQQTEKLEYYSEEEGDDKNEEQYEVVQNQMQQSKILTEEKTKSDSKEAVQGQLTSKPEEKQKKEVRVDKRQEILCQAEETAQFYQEDN